MASKGRGAGIPLYRSILRAHKRYLPFEMKALGDSYVKSEFKLFRSVTSEGQLDQFFTGWNQYLDEILKTARTKETVSAGSLQPFEGNMSFGKHLPPDIDLSDEQKKQLEKLKEETSRVGLPQN
jgi:hypothetical protein